MAALIGTTTTESSSPAAEASNLAIRGAGTKLGAEGLLVITSTVEHPATIEPMAERCVRARERRACSSIRASVIDVAGLEQALRTLRGAALVDVRSWRRTRPA